MRVSQIPPELVTILNERAGREHSQDGSVLKTLAEILTIHTEMIADQNRDRRSVLIERERELLILKGPCSNFTCRLHYAHSGPCDCD